VFAQITELHTCAINVEHLAESYFVAGTPGYRRDSKDGYCVRSTDNEYDFDNLTELLDYEPSS
jgi:hypothetical protein